MKKLSAWGVSIAGSFIFAWNESGPDLESDSDKNTV